MNKKVLLCMLLLLVIPLVLAYGDGDGHDENRTAEAVVDDVIENKLRTASYAVIGIGIVLAGLLISHGIHKHWKWGKILGYIIAIIAILLIGYSFYYFQLTASETTGITVCDSGQCFWAAHVHSDIHVSVCNEDIELGLEKGNLGKLHTHKEKNRLHFHERLPVDPATKEISDTNDLQLRTFFDSIDMIFNSTCIDDKCDGDLCGEIPGTVVMTVNDIPNIEYETYAYSDGDNIKITFK